MTDIDTPFWVLGLTAAISWVAFIIIAFRLRNRR